MCFPTSRCPRRWRCFRCGSAVRWRRRGRVRILGRQAIAFSQRQSNPIRGRRSANAGDLGDLARSRKLAPPAPHRVVMGGCFSRAIIAGVIAGVSDSGGSSAGYRCAKLPRSYLPQSRTSVPQLCSQLNRSGTLLKAPGEVELRNAAHQRHTCVRKRAAALKALGFSPETCLCFRPSRPVFKHSESSGSSPARAATWPSQALS